MKLLFSFIKTNVILIKKGRVQEEVDEQYEIAVIKRKASLENTCAGAVYDL